MYRSKAFTQYVKAGGRNQAEADFYSVRPSNVLDYGVRPSEVLYLNRLVGKPTMWFPNRSDTNRPVQL